MTGKWNESMSYQPCDLEGEPLPDTELLEVCFLFCLKKSIQNDHDQLYTEGHNFVFTLDVCCFLGLSIAMLGKIQFY